LTQVHGRVVWSGLADHDAIAGAAGLGAAGGPDGPAGCGDAAGGHRQRNRSASVA